MKSIIIHLVCIYGNNMFWWNGEQCKCKFPFVKMKKKNECNTQISIFFIWKYFLIQCEHAVEPQPIFLYCIFISVFTMLLFRVKQRQNSNEKKMIWKKNETNNAFFHSFGIFTYFAHYLMLIFLLKLILH